MIFDYIIVGAGSAGCVLAYRLSENPDNKVLVLEAGRPDTSPMISMPKGFGKLLLDPDHCWYFPIEPEAGSNKPEVWVRGRTLGGSSSVNGEVYHRGQPQDYDGWANLGNNGWGWSSFLDAYKNMENHALGGNEYRGGEGRLSISIAGNQKHLTNRALIDAAQSMGIPYKEDFNGPGDVGVGYFPQTVGRGVRSSASKAFLKPACNRPNVRVITGALAEHIIFEGARAVGVKVAHGQGPKETFLGREIIISAGAIQTPKILQLSGVGPAEHLRKIGVDVVHDSPGVGANMLEHRYLRMQFGLNTWAASYNREFSGLNLVKNVMQYFITHTGILASCAYDVALSAKSKPDLDRADFQLNMLPASLGQGKSRFTFEKEPGMNIICYPMRPRSQGSVMAATANPADAPTIRANYLTDTYDRDVSVRMVGVVRALFNQPALRQLVTEESEPGSTMSSPQGILDEIMRNGGPCQHASSTCRMGVDEGAVVDPNTRVIGVDGLRVVDGSIMPTMVSGNTNAPIMAMGWIAAEKILSDQST